MKQPLATLAPAKPREDQVTTILYKDLGTPVPDLTKPQLLTVKQFATVLQVSERHVENLIARGLIRTVPNLGRSVRLAPAEALRFINAPSAGEVA